MPFEFNFISSLLFAGTLTGGLATSGLLLRALWRRTPADALLALLIALPTLKVAERMLYYGGWATGHADHARWLAYFPWYVGLALGPSYYLYFRSLTNQDFRWRPLLKHLLPGLLQIGLAAVAAAYDLLWLGGPPAGTLGPAATLLNSLDHPLLTLLGYASLLGYSLHMLADYRRYYRYLDDHFSNPERLRFAGLRQLLVLQLLGLGLSVGFTLLDSAFDYGTGVGWLAFALRGLLIYGLLAVGLEANYAAATSPLRFELDAPPEPPPAAASQPAGLSLAAPATEASTAESAPAPDTPPTEPAAAETPAAELPPDLLPYRNKLLRLMSEQRPWLEPELNLAELAHRLALHPVLLSKVINTGCGQSFSDFVNTYRVEEARRKLADPAFGHYSLVGVALDSGFNSKSTFNRVFKKLAGTAPSEVPRPKL